MDWDERDTGPTFRPSPSFGQLFVAIVVGIGLAVATICGFATYNAP